MQIDTKSNRISVSVALLVVLLVLFSQITPLIAAATTTYVPTESLVYGGDAGANGKIWRTNLDTGESAVATTAPIGTIVNSMAANSDNGLLYYGSNKKMYCWNPETNTHSLLKDFSNIFPGNVGLLDSGGAAFYDGKLYIGPEYTSDGGGCYGDSTYYTGDIYDVYELTLSDDGRSVSSYRRLNIVGSSGYSPCNFGSFGDIIIKRDTSGGLLLGSSGRQESGWFWSLDLNTNTFTRINKSMAGVYQLTQTISGRVFGTLNGSKTMYEIDPNTGAILPSATIPLCYDAADLTEPYNARTGNSDISIVKTASDPTPLIGSTISFNIAVKNNGPDLAEDITVQDAVPSGFTYVAGTIAGGDSRGVSGTTLNWAIDSLASGSTVNLTFSAVVNASGDYTNTAALTGVDQCDPNPGNNSSTVTVTPRPNCYNVTAQADPAQGGTVSGTGNYAAGSLAPMAATSATGWHFVNWTYENGTLVSSSASFDYTVPNADSVLVAHFTVDDADLSLIKEASNLTPFVGSTVTFKLTLANNGPNAAYNVTVTDVMPDGYTYVAGSIAGGTSCSEASAPTLTWKVDALAAGASIELICAAVVNPTGNYTNTAAITGTDQKDPDPDDNTSTVTTTPAAVVINASVEGQGSVDGAGFFNYNQPVTLAATPATGWHFTGWTEGGSPVSTDPTLIFNATADRDLVAHFAPDTYTVTATANPPMGGSVTGSGSYTAGTVVTMTATPADGYVFTLWVDGSGNTVSTTASFEYTVPAADSALVALFAEVAAEVTTPQFYFAEGYTGAGFQEYLCLGQPGDAPIVVTVTYLFANNSPITKDYSVPAHSRITIDVNAEVGPDQEVSIKCTSEDPFVSERPMYFDYKGIWTGGHDSVGASLPSATWFFAEGYTGPGFEEYVCVLNDTDVDASADFFFQTQEAGEIVIENQLIPARSRRTFNVNVMLAGDYQSSLKIVSSQPVVAERPMYFNYQGTANRNWTGGHCVMGVPSITNEYFLAEGTTRNGFEEWITIQNPNAAMITVLAGYQLGTGEVVNRSYDIEAGRRFTVLVPEVIGPEQDVSVHLTSTADFLAERPMYFNYRGMGGWSWTGGHCVVGTPHSSTRWFFAEGYTGYGFEEWLTVQNTGDTDANVAITYYPEGGADPVNTTHLVAAHSRYTVMVNFDAGADMAISAMLTSDKPVICERPMYFLFNNEWTGGHCVMGYQMQ